MAIENPFRNMTKPQLYATIAGSAGVGGYLLYRHHKTSGSWNPFSAGSSSTTSATTSSTSIDPVTGLPYSQDNAIDPVTGLTYLAEAEQYGSIATAEASVSQFGTTATGGTTITGTPQPNGTVSGSTNPPGSPYTSNAGWAQAVQAGLADIGYAATDVGTAIGLYLTGEPLTADQAKIVNTAIAEFGSPPVGTFQVILAPASGPTGPTTGTSPGSAPKTAPAGMSSTGHAGFADFGWGVVSGATGYELQVSGTGGKGTGTSGLDETFTGNHAANVKLNPGTYKAQVRATNTAGSGPWASFPNFTVTK